MPTAQEKRKRISGSIRFAATQLVVAGWLAMILPSTAVENIPSSYQNTYRGCAGRLLNVGISPDAAATACAGALRPRDLSRCVVDIKQRTDLAAEDALATCRQARRPNEVARCVVGISRNSGEEAVAGVLDYCGRRSLLPTRFAECVVGLRRETDIASTQAMESCIDESAQINEFAPNFVPANQTPTLPAPLTPPVSGDPTPLAEPTPAPNAPTGPGTQTPPAQITPAPTGPGNQAPPVQQTPTPTAPANPGGG